MNVGWLASAEPAYMHADVPPDAIGVVRAGLRAAETEALYGLWVRRTWGYAPNLRRAFGKLLANLVLYREEETALAGICLALEAILREPLRPTLQLEAGSDLRALHWWGPERRLTPLRLGCLEEEPIAATALQELLDRGALEPDVDPDIGHVVLRPPPAGYPSPWAALRPWVAGAFAAYLAEARGPAVREALGAAFPGLAAVATVEEACERMASL